MVSRFASLIGLAMPLGLMPFLLAAAPSGPQPAEPGITEKDRSHWSFRPVRQPAVPAVRDGSWGRTPIDAFILARLEKNGLRPNGPAERADLLRRLTFDLTGLPPTVAGLDDYLCDTRPDAYDRAVERLLASPHFGEYWAQHWLDVVRYAETNGYEGDGERYHAWRYRDYVVRAFNEDRPFDRFVTEQVAGDLLADEPAKHGMAVPDNTAAELLVAAGLNRCGPVHITGGNLDPVVLRQELLTEMTTTTGSAFLGLTMGCARCHNHKFDPVSQVDYYRLQAFFGAAVPKEVNLATAGEKAEYERRVKQIDAKIQPLRKEVAAMEAPYQARLTAEKKAKLEAPYRTALAVDPKKRTPEQARLAEHARLLIKVSWDEIVAALTASDRERRTALRARMHALEATKPAPLAQAWTLAENGTAPSTYQLKRGDPHQQLARITPSFIRVLAPAGSDAPVRNRLDLARWLTAPDHPLTARVIVNRLWQHHFGRGLVATPNDFGLRGEQPSHGELLDWLARELVTHGWSLKHLHRLMVRSATYQQASRGGERRSAHIDPDNRLLWRMNRRRVSGEGLRDCVLAVTGELDEAIGGPHVKIPLEPAVYELIFSEAEPDDLWTVTLDRRQHRRRSLYLFNKRNVRLPLFEAFDQPDTLTSCPVRPVSTYAPQALILLNGPFMQEQSKSLAMRLLRECGPDRAARVDRAYRLALARQPEPMEREQALLFLAAQEALLRGKADGARAALADFCLALFNRNEFVYVP